MKTCVKMISDLRIKSLISLMALYSLSMIMINGSFMVSYYNIPHLVLLGLLIIPLYTIFIYREKKIHLIALTTLAISMTLLIPLRGILVSGDFNTEFTSGKITVLYGTFMPDFSPPHSAVAVNSLLNPILSIITGVDILQVFRFSAIIPIFLLSISSYMFYRIILKEEDAFISTIFLITQFYIIEGCVWPARHMYSLALLLLLAYEFVKDRKTVIILSIAIATYYYAMGYLATIFIFLLTFILTIIYKYKLNVNIGGRGIIIHGVTVAIIIFSTTFLWYSQEGSILSLTGHIKIIIRFLSEFFRGVEPEQLGITERRLVQSTFIGDYLTYGSMFLLTIVSGLGTLYMLVELIKSRKVESDNNKISAYTFILTSWIVFVVFFVPLMAGSLGVPRIYEVFFTFSVAMIPIGLGKTVQVLRTALKYVHKYLYLAITCMLLLLSIMANAKIFYFILNEEPLSIMFTKNSTQDMIWRVSRTEIEAGLFLMKYRQESYPIYGDEYSLRRPSLFWNGSSAVAYRSLFLTLPSKGSYEGYVFLDRYNLYSGELLVFGKAWTFTPLRLNLFNGNKVYSNNHTEVYFVGG